MSLKDVFFLKKNSKDAEIEDKDGIRQRATLVIDAEKAISASLLKVPIDNYFLQQNDVSTTTIADTVVVDSSAGRQIQVDDPSSFSVGDIAVLVSPGNIYFGEVLNVAVDILTCDALIPVVFSSGSEIQSFTRDLSVDGSVTPQRFSIFGSGAANVQLNITRLVWTALCATAVDLSKFGDIIGGLTNGMILQGVPEDFDSSNQFVIKTNADLDNLTGTDWKPYAATNPAQGQDGFSARYTYGNLDKHDVIVPINMGDRLDLIIQDDQTTITQLYLLFGGNQEINL